MKTVEQLAEEYAADIGDGWTERLLGKGSILFDDKEQLEALCKAYLQDRLESLEPFGFVSELSVKRFKTGRPAAIAQKQTKICNIPLHDISTLKDKP